MSRVALAAALRAFWRDARAYAPVRPWRLLGITWAATLSAWGIVTLWAWHAGRTLGDPAQITGWSLLAAMLGLGAFNLRKRLVVLPVGSARAWMVAHGVVGVVSLPLYFQHTGTVWPDGFYERVLALLFYVTMGSGAVGYLMERLLPRRLTDLDREILFERIPSEIADLRAQAEALVLRAMQDAGTDTLGRYYAESLDWYFWKPRFLFSHLVGSGRATRWIRGHISALGRYLGERERAYLDQLRDIALRKSQVDAHLALQGALKYWLFVHVPAALLLVLAAGWHLLVVHIYAR